ncbi:tyrosine-type recombinase/integrase [archaeon]|jgi:integrase/recombinase XerD|nr:tyrosine-type recombinase/integrase [archaeon]MBT4417399.1 tyrosine-type recombinase/integrase [archaeon]
MDLILNMQKEMSRRRYSQRTVDSYSDCVTKFLEFSKKTPRKITKKDVRLYLTKLDERNLASSTMNVYLQAIRFALENILNKHFILRIPLSKKSKRLPDFLTKKEVKQLFSVIKNKKHLLVVKLIYSAGLRVGEAVKLRIRDLDLESGIGKVVQGKGNKDRMFIIAKSIRKELQHYIYSEKLDFGDFLFQGRRTHFSVRSVQEVVKKAGKRSKIPKNVHPHVLRHSFATHLIEDNCSLSTLQLLMGHKSPETTMVYVHLAKLSSLDVTSPLDGL